jgi:hypothetical protein
MLMRLIQIHCSRVVLACACFFSCGVTAEGLADFRAALQRLKSATPVVMNTQFKLFGRTGEHNELIEREGVIDLRLEDGPGGIKASYSNDLVAQLHAEELAKLEDENVKNSALNAVGQFDYWEWRELLHPAAQLELALGRYDFIGETAAEKNGKPVRVLNFSMAKEKVDPKFRKYIKSYKNHLEIWIDEKGVPLASSAYEHGSGRVFIVIGFTFNNEFHSEYQQHAGRLISVKREVREQTEGAAMQSYRHYIATVKSAQ